MRRHAEPKRQRSEDEMPGSAVSAEIVDALPTEYLPHVQIFMYYPPGPSRSTIRPTSIGEPCQTAIDLASSTIV